MSLETDLAALYLRHGASLGLSARLAVADAVNASARITEDRIDQDIADLFYKMPRPMLAERLAIHRSTVYRRHEKLSRQAADDATNAKYPAIPEVASTAS